jgi:hypothetical protein
MYGRELRGFYHAYYHGIYIPRTENKLAWRKGPRDGALRLGEDASPLGEAATIQAYESDRSRDEAAMIQAYESHRSGCHAGGEPRAEP